MSIRIAAAGFLIRLGNFIQSLSVMVMRPDDLVEYSRLSYSRSHNIALWNRKDVVETGLYEEESFLLENIPFKKGRLLLLGVGGGREAIFLAQKGFKVTGIDFVPDLVELTKTNALKKGLEIEGIVQEISKLDVPAESWDIVWLSAAMYSCVPTRKRRVEMLERIRNALVPGGIFLCQFHCNSPMGFTPKVKLIRRIIACLTLGNLWSEEGDMLWGNTEFIHNFSSEDSLISEFEDGGFEIIKIFFPDQEFARGGAVLKKVI